MTTNMQADSSKTTRRWYAVQTKPQAEPVALSNLANQQIEAFCPWRRQTVRHARKLRYRRVSYFPSYVFVALDTANERWRHVNSTYGVRTLLMQGEKPAALPSGFVDTLRALCDDDGLVNTGTGLKVGQDVRILSGPLCDLMGQIDRLDGNDRVRVLIEIASGRMPVVLSRRDVVTLS